MKLCFRNKSIQNKMPVQTRTSILEVNPEEVTALAHHKPQVRAGVTICSTTRCQFCAVGDHVLLESRENQVKKMLETTQRELLVRTSPDQDCQNQFDWVNSSEQGRGVNAERKWIVQVCKEFTKTHDGAEVLKIIHRKYMIGPVLEVFVKKRISVSRAYRD